MVVAMKIVDSALESKFKITETLFFLRGELFSMSQVWGSLRFLLGSSSSFSSSSSSSSSSLTLSSSSTIVK